MQQANSTDLWVEILREVRSSVPEDRFNLWLKDTTLEEITGETCVISVPNRFAREYITSRLGEVLKKAIREITGEQKSLQFLIKADETASTDVNGGKESPAVPPKLAPTETVSGLYTPLREDMTFDKFVVGPCNRLAHAAALGSLEGDCFNGSSFFFGNTGLGKTHLLQAACHSFTQRNRGNKVIFMNCGTFVAEFCSAMAGSRRESFRDRFKDVDLFVLDDVHILGEGQKVGTQLEFLHLYNELDLHQRTILFASALHPREIKNLNDGLRSRFMSGVVARMELPKYPTRLAVLKKAFARFRCNIDQSIVELVARSLTIDFRELIGVASCLAMEARMSTTRLSESRVTEILADFVDDAEVLDLPAIEKVVCRHFGLTVEQIRSSRQARSISRARQTAMYLARELLGIAFQEIGDYFGGKNHATVIAATRRVKDIVEKNPEGRALIEKLTSELRPDR